jgi:hypothetical protein
VLGAKASRLASSHVVLTYRQRSPMRALWQLILAASYLISAATQVTDGIDTTSCSGFAGRHQFTTQTEQMFVAELQALVVLLVGGPLSLNGLDCAIHLCNIWPRPRRDTDCAR